MFLGRLRSLNSLGGTRDSRWWRKILGTPLPSPDSLGRVPAQVDPGPIRQTLIDFCRDLRRKKALPVLADGLVALVFDGHESTSSYLRQCPGCAQRRVGKEDEPRIQFYHRYVFCSLVGADFHVFVDVEPAYLAAVRRATRPSRFEVYPLDLRAPLPDLPVPLRDGEDDVLLPLQTLIDRVYSAGGHDDIDYRRPADPPLGAEDERWARELLASAGRR